MAKHPFKTEGESYRTLLAKTDSITLAEAKSILEIFAKERRPHMQTQSI